MRHDTARLLVAALATAFTANAAADALLHPDAAFVQAGDGNHTRTVTAGADWNLPWHKSWGSGELSGYIEASIGRWWIAESNLSHRAWVTQAGLTPVLRYRFGDEHPQWFTEIGIGANVLAPILQDHDRRFSTVFNFGDHIGLGRSFGDNDANEIAVRVEHFSNGGIKQPNPGINFLQLRYLRRF